MDHGRALCEQGEIGQGLLWLARSLRAGGRGQGRCALDRAARINLADWSARLSRPLCGSGIRRPPATWPSGPTAGRSSPWARTGRAFLGHRHLARGRAATLRRRSRREGRLRGASRVRLPGSGTLAIFDPAGRPHFWDAWPMASHRAYADVPPARSRPSRRLRRRWPAPARVRRRGPASPAGRDDGATGPSGTPANRGGDRRPRDQPRRPHAWSPEATTVPVFAGNCRAGRLGTILPQTRPPARRLHP